jgi:hypothetical protein
MQACNAQIGSTSAIITRQPWRAEALCRALAHVAVAEDERCLAREHDVGCAHDAVDERVAATVEIVELRLRDGVVHVDRWEEQLTKLLHLIETMHAGRRLFAHAADVRHDAAEHAVRVAVSRSGEEREDDLGIPRHRSASQPNLARLLELETLVDEEGEVTAVVKDHVRALTIWPVHRLVGAPPVLREGFALPREDWNTLRILRRSTLPDRDRSSGVVLRREDVARSPTHFRAEFNERLNEDSRLNRHVQRARRRARP